MDEAVVRGLVVGTFLGVLGLAANFTWKLIRSQSNSARRLKIAGGIAVVIAVGSMLIEAMGPSGAVGTVIVIAALVWVIKGFKQKDAGQATRSNAAPSGSVPEREATAFAEVEAIEPERKTIISCPNCSGRLRVVAGRYIDVTCPHCKTVFRTHT